VLAIERSRLGKGVGVERKEGVERRIRAGVEIAPGDISENGGDPAQARIGLRRMLLRASGRRAPRPALPPLRRYGKEPYAYPPAPSICGTRVPWYR
jgi:hypothetical protein